MQAKALDAELLDQVKTTENIKSEEHSESEERPASSRRERGSSNPSGISVPAEVRKKRVGKVMELLDKESELVDAAQAKLERLSITPTAA